MREIYGNAVKAYYFGIDIMFISFTQLPILSGDSR